LAPKHLLATWVRLAAVASAYPDRQWTAVSVGRGKKNDTPRVVSIAFDSADDARRVLEFAVDLHDRSHSDVVPMMPATALAIHRKGVAAGAKQWSTMFGCNSDRWVEFALGLVDLHVLLAEVPRSHEVGLEWGSAESRVERWAYRVWSTVEATVGTDVLEVFDV
jgi:exodeoxyribonuclease V gamma subunit